MSSEPRDRQELREPQFLHFSSILFDLASHGRELLMPVVFGFLGAASGSWFWGLIAVLAFGLAVLRTLFRYFTLRYRIDNGELALSQGWIFRTQRTVPLKRIQNVDLRQNIMHRWFGVAEVRIETASGSEAEAILRVLTRPQIDQLRAAIFGPAGSGTPEMPAEIRPPLDGASAGEAPPVTPAVAPTVSIGPSTESRHLAGSTSRELLRIPLGWLVIAGLAGNRGWLMVGLAVGAFFQFDLHERILPQRWERWLARLRWNWGDLWENWPSVLAILVAGLLLLKLLGVAWYVYRFFGYRLERIGEDLRVSAGLLSTYSTSIPRQRIQFVSLHRPWVLGWFGFVSIRIETAGGAGGDENSQENIARTWFVPVIPAQTAFELLTELRPGLEHRDSELNWQSPAAVTFRRLLRIGLTGALLITATMGWWFWPWGWLIGLLIVPHQIWYALSRSRSLRYARTEQGVVFRSGIFYRKLSYTFFDRIQTISLSQTPFDRRWGMATLLVDTAAAGPADHQIAVPYLAVDVARGEFQALQQLSARNQPQWK